MAKYEDECDWSDTDQAEDGEWRSILKLLTAIAMFQIGLVAFVGLVSD